MTFLDIELTNRQSVYGKLTKMRAHPSAADVDVAFGFEHHGTWMYPEYRAPTMAELNPRNGPVIFTINAFMSIAARRQAGADRTKGDDPNDSESKSQITGNQEERKD